MKKNLPRNYIILNLISLPENELHSKLDSINQQTFLHLEKYRLRRQESGNYRNFHPYKHLRKTNLWRDAKEIWIALNIKNYGQLSCEICKNEITDFGILHHYEYGDNTCFSHCGILCNDCHTPELHKK